MKQVRGALVAVDGVDASEIVAAARAKIAGLPRPRRGGVSLWDASGVFDDLVVAGADAGVPSPRTLLLLYAADLAFRLRWEIKPVLAEGRVVAAAPYVATAIAFGRAAGLPSGWLHDLFSFAPKPTEACHVDASAARSGFIEFGCVRLAERRNGSSRQAIVDRTRQHLRAASRSRGGRAR
jgi:dTMP kinase